MAAAVSQRSLFNTAAQLGGKARTAGVMPTRRAVAAQRSEQLRVHASAGPGPGLVSFSGATPGPGLVSFRGGAAAAPRSVAVKAEPAKAKAPSKARLPSLDSLRFFLIAYIAVGHFAVFATKSSFALALLTQASRPLSASCLPLAAAR